MSRSSVTVVGDGQMGLVMADAFHRGGSAVRVWGPFASHREELAETRITPRLEGFTLDPSIEVCASAAAAVTDATLLVNAIPTQFIRPVWREIGQVCAGQPVVSVAKGVENQTLLRPTEILAETIREAGGQPGSCGTLSGPTIAVELAQRLPAAMVARVSPSRKHACARADESRAGVAW